MLRRTFLQLIAFTNILATGGLLSVEPKARPKDRSSHFPIEKGFSHHCINTGICEIDKIIGGVPQNDVTLIVCGQNGRTSIIGTKITMNIAFQDAPVSYISTQHNNLNCLAEELRKASIKPTARDSFRIWSMSGANMMDDCSGNIKKSVTKIDAHMIRAISYNCDMCELINRLHQHKDSKVVIIDELFALKKRL